MSRWRRVAQRHGSHHYTQLESDGMVSCRGAIGSGTGCATVSDATGPGSVWSVTAEQTLSRQMELGDGSLHYENGGQFWFGSLIKYINYSSGSHENYLYTYLSGGSTNYHGLTKSTFSGPGNGVWFWNDCGDKYSTASASNYPMNNLNCDYDIEAAVTGAELTCRNRNNTTLGDTTCHWANIWLCQSNPCRRAYVDQSDFRGIHCFIAKAIGYQDE